MQSSRRRVVLVVDDEPELRRVLARRIGARSGMQVVEAADGISALTFLSDHAVDVVVSDLRFPRGPDGESLLETVGRRWPGVRRLLLTGHASGAMVADAPYPVVQKGALDWAYLVDQIVKLARQAA